MGAHPREAGQRWDSPPHRHLHGAGKDTANTAVKIAPSRGTPGPCRRGRTKPERPAGLRLQADRAGRASARQVHAQRTLKDWSAKNCKQAVRVTEITAGRETSTEENSRRRDGEETPSGPAAGSKDYSVVTRNEPNSAAWNAPDKAVRSGTAPHTQAGNATRCRTRL